MKKEEAALTMAEVRELIAFTKKINLWLYSVYERSVEDALFSGDPADSFLLGRQSACTEIIGKWNEWLSDVFPNTTASDGGEGN